MHNRYGDFRIISRVALPDELVGDGHHSNGAGIGVRQSGLAAANRIDADCELASGDRRKLAADELVQQRCARDKSIERSERNFNARALRQQHRRKHTTDQNKRQRFNRQQQQRALG